MKMKCIRCGREFDSSERFNVDVPWREGDVEMSEDVKRYNEIMEKVAEETIRTNKAYADWVHEGHLLDFEEKNCCPSCEMIVLHEQMEHDMMCPVHFGPIHINSYESMRKDDNVNKAGK